MKVIPSGVFPVAEIQKYQKYANFATTTVVPDSEIPRNIRNANPDYAPIQRYTPRPNYGGGRFRIPKRNIQIPQVSKGPAMLAALGAASIAAGTAGQIFTRRRRTKKGKVVVEQVRRKAR